MRPIGTPHGASRLGVFRWLLAVAIVLGFDGFATRVRSAGPHLVIAQVYAGGQSDGAPFARDYVVLFNRGASSSTLDSRSLQYAAAGGSTWRSTSLAGTLPSGGFYLDGLAAGDTGAQVPLPDAEVTSALSATGGKLALVESTVPLGCGADPSCATVSGVRDFVGYGPGASAFGGSGAAPSPGKSQAPLRRDDGCSDTDEKADQHGRRCPPLHGRPQGYGLARSLAYRRLHPYQ